jgi:hypothetical protein
MAQAGSVTYTTIVPLNTTDLTNESANPPTGSAFLQEFNPSLGTLESVTITLEASGGTNFSTIKNTSASSTTFVAYESSTVWLDDLNNSTIDTNLLGDGSPSTNYLTNQTQGQIFFNSHTYLPDGESGGTTLAAGATTSASATSSDDEFVTTTDPTWLAAFVGVGDLDIVLSTLSGGGYYATGGANINIVETTQAGGTVKVEYDYSGGPPPPVPEPGTLGLFGTGLLGLAGLLRFRFMKSK